MRQILASLGRLPALFILLSVAVVLMFLGFYAFNVMRALDMDPNSYNCTEDGMMMQLCHNPYGASLLWSLLYAVFFGWPLLLAWLITGLALLLRPTLRRP